MMLILNVKGALLSTPCVAQSSTSTFMESNLLERHPRAYDA